MSFAVGSRVQLNSGGPKMTVESVDGNRVKCAWFYENEIKRDTFDAAMLKDPARIVVASSGRRRSAFMDDY